jgi:hypothetical protein
MDTTAVCSDDMTGHKLETVTEEVLPGSTSYMCPMARISGEFEPGESYVFGHPKLRQCPLD